MGEGRRERQRQGGRRTYIYGERNVRAGEKGKRERGRGKGVRER